MTLFVVLQMPRPRRTARRCGSGTSQSTRLKPSGKIVLTLTRWSTDDIAGRILERMDDGTGGSFQPYRDHRRSVQRPHPLQGCAVSSEEDCVMVIRLKPVEENPFTNGAPQLPSHELMVE